MFANGRTFFFLCLAAAALFLTATYNVNAGECSAGTDSQIRVALQKGAASVECTVSGNYRLVQLPTGKVLDVAQSGDGWRFDYVGGEILVGKNGTSLGSFSGPLAFEATNPALHLIAGTPDSYPQRKYVADGLSVCGRDGQVAKLDGARELFIQDSNGKHKMSLSEKTNLFSLGLSGARQYRGNMVFYAEGDGLMLVNELPVEEYLCGVIPNEMPAEWPLEALKAQAVASRSYLAAEAVNNKQKKYDVLATDQSQVYGGYGTECESTNKAVWDTAGEILMCHGSYVQAFFHSSSGGFIEASSEVWLESLPYIQPKEDPYDFNEKHYGWMVYYTNEQLTNQVNAKLADLGYGVRFAALDDINALEYTATGARIKKMSFKGVDGGGLPLYFEINVADRVRILLGLKSACFTFNKEFDNNNRLTCVTFNGDGFGHGLGMSQYGAKGMALAGNNYRDILQYYYYDVQLAQNYAGSKGYASGGF